MTNRRNLIRCILSLILFILYTESKKVQTASESGMTIANNEDESQINKKWQQYLQDNHRQIQDENHNFQTKHQPQYVLQYKSDVRQRIIDRAVRPEEDRNYYGITQNNFNSFLEITRPIMQFESPHIFFGYNVNSNANSLPLSGQAARKPWSASFFPVRNGVISVRYSPNSSNTIGELSNVGAYVNYYTLLQSIFKYNQPGEHNRMYNTNAFQSYVNSNYSPSEKYDLLLGDHSYSLTNYMKRHSQSFAVNGDVPTWFGICHGVAPAAYYYTKPNRAVTVTAADGRTLIKFLPDDIKALAAQFWAGVNYRTRFMGGRCNFYRTQAGFNTDMNCKSLNPASVIITLGNWMGIDKKNLILDPNADPEIWNESAYAYEMRYYNPLSNQFSSSASNAKVAISQIRNSSDQFLRNLAANASPATTHLAGVFMRLTYAVNNQLNYDVVSYPDEFKTQGVDAVVELDAYNNLVGGEWKTESYPNFMWRYDENFPIQGVSDHYVPYFNGNPNQSRSFTNYARNASNQGQLIKAVVQYLIDASS